VSIPQFSSTRRRNCTFFHGPKGGARRARRRKHAERPQQPCPRRDLLEIVDGSRRSQQRSKSRHASIGRTSADPDRLASRTP
jgi:hypothetical protein